MASQALAQRDEASVPDLVRTPALTITAEDVSVPRLYLGQFMSAAVQEQLVKPGSIYAALSGDDPDPQVLYELGDKKKDAGVLFYVLGLRKGKSVSEDGELKLFDYDDPSAPPDAWVTYNYTCLIPDVDTEVPCKLLLTRSSRQTALKINTVLKRTSIAGPAWINGFKLTAAERENKKGKFFVWQVAQVEATKEHVALSAALAPLLTTAPSTFASTGEEPAI